MLIRAKQLRYSPERVLKVLFRLPEREEPSAEKRTNKQAGEKLSNTQSPPKDGEAGKVLGEQPTAIHLR